MKNFAKRNPEVTKFLEEKRHSRNEVIEELRSIILSADGSLVENIKWNGPNYSLDGEDRITMRLFPEKSLQLVLHRGAKPLAEHSARILDEEADFLEWKSNDRAVIHVGKIHDIRTERPRLTQILRKWLQSPVG